MKIFINSLCVISAISVIIMTVLFTIGILINNQYIRFLTNWFFNPFLFLSIPLLGRSFSLFYFKDRIKPITWLLIYGFIFLTLVSIIIIDWSNFKKSAMDVSYAINRKAENLGGKVTYTDIVGNKNKYQLIIISGIKFEVDRKNFSYINYGEEFNITYLPHSKYVIDIVDKNGYSLLSKKKIP